ncbi:MAG: ABC transporter permease [Bdellovibrionales bacterium]|jgi:putative ABC transport system permease protein|nr:ABC transporter permease [Bdellovibrionales bacterium]
MNQILWLAWRNLFRNPRRTLASLLTVALGACGLLIYQGFNTGIMNQYRENTIHGYYGYGWVFPRGYYGKVQEKPWTSWMSSSSEVESQLKSIEGVREVFPRLRFYSFLIKGGITLGGKGEGINPLRESKFFNQMNFIEGHEIRDPNDIIIGRGLAESLGVKVGDLVTLMTQTIRGQLNGIDLNVAGVFHMGIKEIDDQFFRIPIQTAQQLLDTTSTELFSIDLDPKVSWASFQNHLDKIAPTLEGFSFNVLDKVYYQNSVDFLEAQFSFIRAIILLIIALGIFNTIAVGLLERAGEVGALRANGESRARLWKIMGIESILIGLLGGFLGVTIALAINKTLLAKGIPMPPGPGITRHYLILLEIESHHMVQSVILPMVATFLASLWPVRQLLKKSIPDLLRST